MSKTSRLALAALIGLLTLAIGILDPGDPFTPTVIRWPLVVLVAVALAWVTWTLSGRETK